MRIPHPITDDVVIEASKEEVLKAIREYCDEALHQGVDEAPDGFFKLLADMNLWVYHTLVIKRREEG